MRQKPLINGRRLYNEWKQSGSTQAEVFEKYDIPIRTGNRWIRRYVTEVLEGDTILPAAADGPFEFIEDENGATVTSDRIFDPHKLIAAAGISLEHWEIERIQLQYDETHRKNTIRELEWSDGKMTGSLSDDGKMHIEPVKRIKLWLQRREVKPVEDAIDALLSRVRDEAPAFSGKARKSDGDVLLVVGMVDAHFNRLSADGNYTIDKAAENFQKAGIALASKARDFGYSIGRILFPVGNDALNVDNLHGTTTKGTWVETSGKQAHAIRRVLESMIVVIDELATIAHVDVEGVPGNHDFYSTLWLTETLSAWYSNNPNVSVNIDPTPHKFYRFGSVMLGLAHGHEKNPMRLALLMAAEADLTGIKYREWLTAHLHKERGLYAPTSEDGGFTVRTLPALCSPDDWHILKGFVGGDNRALGLFYHFDHGPAGHMPVFVSELPDGRKNGRKKK